MTVLQILTVAMGLLIIALRGPLIFAPVATRGFYLRLIATPRRVRAMAGVLAPLGLVLVAGARSGEDLAAIVMAVLGWMLLAGGAFLVLFPALYQQIAEAVLEALDKPGALRAIGVLGVAVGVFLVSLGLPAG